MCPDLFLSVLQTLAWLLLPLGLLICVAAGCVVYMKRKHNKDAGTQRGGALM